MELIRAFRLDRRVDPPRIAFVGAGGKTTVMFQLARQLKQRVIVSATTHLSIDQLNLADRHLFVDDSGLNDLEKHLSPGITLLTGSVDQTSHRTLGLDPHAIEKIYMLAEFHQVPLLIEADGARQLPLKAPADHEPLIPEFVNLVMVVAGLRGLHQPLVSDFVHRPEIFSSLSGLQIGDNITPASLANVMIHPKGGLKNIPGNARRIALLNQADAPNFQANAYSISSELLQHYNSVIIGSIAGKASSPIAQSALKYKPSIFAVHENIAGVILAAGGSRRFGHSKQLLHWQGQPFIWHVTQNALRAKLKPVIIVCGDEMDAIRQALSGLPVEFVHNSYWHQGQGTSVSLGTKAVNSRHGGILFLLADQPQTSVTLIRALVEHHAQSLDPIIGPVVDGQRANPVLFDQDTFRDLVTLSGEKGGRQLFSKYAVKWISWHDPTHLLDIDTPEDYQQLLEFGL